MQTLSLILCSAVFTAVLPADFWWLDNNVFGGGDQVGAPSPAINPRNNQGNQKSNRRRNNQRNRNNKSYGNSDDGEHNSVKAGNKAQAAAAFCSGTSCNQGPKMASGGGKGPARQSQNNKSGKTGKMHITQAAVLLITQFRKPSIARHPGSRSRLFISGNVALTLTQLSVSSQCPDVSAMPPVSSCSAAVSNCWSVGEPDWDCPDNGLCCFDGCANTCLGSSQPPPSEPAPVPEKQTQSQPDNSPGIGNGLLFPPPGVGYSQPDPDQSAPPSPVSSPAQSPAQSQAPPPQSPSSPPAPAPQTQSSPKRPRPSNVAQLQPQQVL